MLLLSYHSVRYGRTEYSILESGEITEGYAHKAVVTLSLGYSTPYAIVSFLAIGMLAYSLISVRQNTRHNETNRVKICIQSLIIAEKSTLEHPIYSALSGRSGLQHQRCHCRDLAIFLSFPIRNSLVLHVRNDSANTYVFTNHRNIYIISLFILPLNFLLTQVYTLYVDIIDQRIFFNFTNFSRRNLDVAGRPSVVRAKNVQMNFSIDQDDD